MDPSTLQSSNELPLTHQPAAPPSSCPRVRQLRNQPQPHRNPPIVPFQLLPPRIPPPPQTPNHPHRTTISDPSLPSSFSSPRRGRSSRRGTGSVVAQPRRTRLRGRKLEEELSSDTQRVTISRSRIFLLESRGRDSSTRTASWSSRREKMEQTRRRTMRKVPSFSVARSGSYLPPWTSHLRLRPTPTLQEPFAEPTSTDFAVSVVKIGLPLRRERPPPQLPPLSPPPSLP